MFRIGDGGHLAAIDDHGGGVVLNPGPDEPGDRDGHGDAGRPTPATASPTPTRTTVRVIDGGSHAAFVTPSGNITCDMWADSHQVRCDIGEKTWTPPPVPTDCDLSWGDGLYLGEKAEISCAGDTVRDTASLQRSDTSGAVRWYRPELGPTVKVSTIRSAALGYGNALRVGDIVCASEETAVTCKNDAGRGFTLSRTSYRIF